MKANLCNSPASPNVPLCLKSPIFSALGKWLLKGASREPFYNIGSPAIGPRPSGMPLLPADLTASYVVPNSLAPPRIGLSTLCT